ncbi:hypothetical protein HPO96_05055 [Kribbella sandramycini]|uniref:DoxX-like protein n=1 Tax=Kribbella sandramycini TaxID=60450 RepID=A0A7Y4KVS7_9ACTN|nr:hypothetical protein [Kribbella sandramycini]MBB6567796.1 hypothetical protein [Kribbella sandramycini]NOL39608.1 hypothetical protein [Kribbella sandramycini]
MRGYARTVVAVLGVFDLIIAGWMTMFPASFYALPTLDWTPPYSEHLMRDVGGGRLATGIMLTAAAITFDLLLVRVGLLAYTAYASVHLIFHAGHLNHHEPAKSVELVVLFSLFVLFPLAALIATWTERRSS